jgi:hypothetical protein
VEKLLSRLNAVVRPLFTEPVMEAISRASMLTVLSNFPLGLATMPGDTAPLAARLPLTYEPLLPLTRTVKKVGVLGVECGVAPPRRPDNRLRHQHQRLPGRSYERFQQSTPGPVTDSRLSG